MALLRIILILFIIFYVVRLVTRYILPGLFYNYMDDKVKEFNRMQAKQRQKEQEKARQREGEITIDYKPGKSGKDKPSGGEYVDYIEIKD